jgi:hypothetical protein
MPREEPGIGSTDPAIPISNNYPDDKLHFVPPGGCKDYNDDSDEINDSDAILTTCRPQRAATELDRLELATSDVDRYSVDHGDNADADCTKEAFQADDGSKQTLEDSGYSTRDCEDLIVYFRPVKYNNGKANAKASNICEVKTVLY